MSIIFSIRCFKFPPATRIDYFYALNFQISEDVTRKKCEYQKHLEYYKLLRSKFEEHYIKGKRISYKSSIGKL